VNTLIYKGLRRLLLTVFSIGLFSSFTFKHPFYLSVTDLKYNEAEKSLQGSVKLFTNDLEDALKRIYKVQIDLINGKDKASNTKILEDYIKKNLSVKTNSQAVKLTVIGYEQESEAVWIYLESGETSVPKKVEIENALLYDYLKSQINIVHCEVKGQSKSSKVTNPEKKIVFEF
jgi:hypothetical protein